MINLLTKFTQTIMHIWMHMYTTIPRGFILVVCIIRWQAAKLPYCRVLTVYALLLLHAWSRPLMS